MALKKLLDKLKEKFSWKGKNLKELFLNIFARNRMKVEDNILQSTMAEWKKQEKTLGKLNLPKAEDLKNTPAKLVKLAQLRGQPILDSIKEDIVNDLRKAIEENKNTMDGAILSDEAISSFRSKLNETIKSYKATDGKIDTIALTESRNIINPTKRQYANLVESANPDLEILKIWQHYPWKSKEPREGHRQMNGVTLPLREEYKVPYYIKRKATLILKGIDYMKHPHDEEAPARQVINCHCDIRIIAKRIKR